MLEEKIEKIKRRIKTEEVREVEAEVFDRQTLLVLTKLISDKIIDQVEFPIATGKEAVIFRARSGNELLVLKIYRLTASIFKDLAKYVVGDPRFAGLRKKDIVLTWARKEYKNLQRLAEVGVRVPVPVVCRGNVLVMEYIGTESRAAPMLKDVEKPKNPRGLFRKVVGYTKRAYQEAKLVHGDLSEYNILIKSHKPVLIDVGQAVVLEHPLAQELLKRDVNNIVRYFRKLGIAATGKELLKVVKGEKCKF